MKWQLFDIQLSDWNEIFISGNISANVLESTILLWWMIRNMLEIEFMEIKSNSNINI